MYVQPSFSFVILRNYAFDFDIKRMAFSQPLKILTKCIRDSSNLQVISTDILTKFLKNRNAIILMYVVTIKRTLKGSKFYHITHNFTSFEIVTSLQLK